MVHPTYEMDSNPAEQLRLQRAALESLATALESIEEDARIATREFKVATQNTKKFISELEREAQNIAADQAGDSKDDDMSFVVMLASSSRWRRALIASILPDGCQLADNPISPDIDEKAIRRDDPEEMVKAIAHAKADKVLSVLASTRKTDKVDVIICADQVVVYDTQVREKPLTKEQAKDHLVSYGLTGTPAKCITAVVVVCTNGEKPRFEGTDTSLQYFKKIPDRVVDALIAKGDIMHCAGSFVVEDPLLAPYLGERIGELESVQGMPKSLSRKLILEASAAFRKQAEISASKQHKLAT